MSMSTMAIAIRTVMITWGRAPSQRRAVLIGGRARRAPGSGAGHKGKAGGSRRPMLLGGPAEVNLDFAHSIGQLWDSARRDAPGARRRARRAREETSMRGLLRSIAAAGLVV